MCALPPFRHTFRERYRKHHSHARDETAMRMQCVGPSESGAVLFTKRQHDKYIHTTSTDMHALSARTRTDTRCTRATPGGVPGRKMGRTHMLIDDDIHLHIAVVCESYCCAGLMNCTNLSTVVRRYRNGPRLSTATSPNRMGRPNRDPRSGTCSCVLLERR